MTREGGAGAWFDRWGQDARFGLRLGAQRPAPALLACVLPARQAAKVDPLVALRSE